jgi:hypothetical protein
MRHLFSLNHAISQSGRYSQQGLELPVKANDAAESDHNYFDRLCDRIPADSTRLRR